MLKAPITIQEDLDSLESEAENTINHLMEDMEIFFEPMSKALQELINPEPKDPEPDEAQP